MKASDIRFRRSLNHAIVGRKWTKPGDTVRQLGAMQAQDYHQVLWAIGVRTEQASAADIEQSFTNREIVLTWAMRGTIHAMPPEDVKANLQLLAPRLLAGDKRRLEQLELTPDILEQSREMLVRELCGNRRIARPDLMRAFENAGIRTNGQRGYYLLWHHAQNGLICLGPREGKQQTFVLLDEWVPPQSRTLTREETLTRLTEQYYTAHGPATVQDYAWWAGLTLTDARNGIDLARDRLESASVGDQVYWFAPSSPGSGKIVVQPGVYLLPGFDEYLLGYKNRAIVLRDEYAKYIVPGNNGMFMPMIVVDGQVAGTWKRHLKKRGMDIELTLFIAQDDRTDELNAVAEHYCKFMDLPLSTMETQILNV